MSGSRTTALIIVALAHVGVFALLALYRPDIIKKIVAPIEAVQVKEEKPPPEEPPPPPPKEQEIPPYVPPPEVTVASEPAPVVITTQSNNPAPPPPVFQPPAPPAPAPAPPAPTGPTQRATANDRVFAVSEDDYPPSSLRAEEQGVTGVTVTIGTDGRVSSCQVTTSSNFPKLDERTCKIAQTRWRFKPALENGKPVTDTISKRIRWQINGK